MRWLVSLEDGIGLYGDRCISEIPQQAGNLFNCAIKLKAGAGE